MRSIRFACVLFVLAAVATTRADPSDGGKRPEGGARPESPEVRRALEEWRTRNGDAWRIETDAETGYARMLFGGHARPAFAPRTDADFVRLARNAVSETQGVHGVVASSLALERALFLPLGQIGSSDKETVRLRQEIGGVRVVGGFVNVLFDARGAMLSVQSTALPELAALDTRPSVDATRALDAAARAFADRIGHAATRFSTPELVIDQELVMKRRSPVLAWRVEALAENDGALPDGFAYFIDAHDARVLRRESIVHTFDVQGTVTSNATPGLLPDTATNPPVPQPMAYLTVTSAQGNATTDANGNFTIPGVNVPVAVTFTYTGSFATVQNSAGPAFTLTQTLPPNQPNTVLMNAGSLFQDTAQANALEVVGEDRDFVRSINPLDGTADFVALVHTNLAQTCNAYYDGVSLNFFSAGGQCVNTAYSTVVSHEHGHWFNDLYGTGNGFDGMGEGNADVWAMYRTDDPIVGKGFGGPGTYVRSGLNTRQFCGDANPGCYGEVHSDGEVWMGAAWKVRAHLEATNGSAMGAFIANNLFLAWMSAYNQQTIQSIIETQWLTLDDNDGLLGNGTPHVSDIDAGFVAQGFPPFVPPATSIAGVPALPDQTCEAASYTVTATLTPLVAPPVTSAVVRWRVNGGQFTDAPMTHTSGNDWSGTIPGQLSPARFEYYVKVTDSAAHVNTYPDHAPADVLGFTIGIPVTVFSDDFETAGSNGWTHGSVGDTQSSQDEWQHGIPLGLSGTSFGVQWTDPSTAASGSKCWGIDLGIAGSDGAYSDDVHPYLRSPAINCTGTTGTRLRFKRWLTCEEGIYDKARVLVNGAQVFVNQLNGHTIDTSWSQQEINISAQADNKPSVVIQFDLKSDGGLHLGGWQIDDVELVSYVSAPPCCAAAVNFCVVTPNSTGVGATISTSGSTSIAANNFALTASGCPAYRLGRFIYGPNQTQQAFGNGTLCVGGATFKLPIVPTSSTGDAQFQVNFSQLPSGGHITAGSTWSFQFVVRDPTAGGSNFNLSDGATATFCP
jgi:hypothetical protein